MNRLASEQSPYLIQHADNPVNWYPWGDEAFAKARAEDKPIFLSVGYSTCHWCHVMAHESFENAAVAAVLNEHFVSVKVDREERPDVDRVYMAFVQATTGSGGWPMSVWLTPDLKPFYGGTYYPPASRWGRPGFVDILQEVARIWRVDRQKVVESADAVVSGLRERAGSPASSSEPAADVLPRIVMQFRASYDPRHGGFGDAPKFPRPSELLFLLREHARTGDPEALRMVRGTLSAMAAGGVRDHVGGGFHRYSVDAAWRVPHFEKMLYDQAQLVLAYVEAAQASGDPFYLEVAEDTLAYVRRDMTGEGGGFYSAEDADSVPPEHAADAQPHKAEGAFYLWRAQELDELLGDDRLVVARRFGVEANGNAPADPQQEFVGKNLLFVAHSLEELAKQFDKTPEAIAELLNRSRAAMFRVRSQRPRPHLDDKVLTAWNGLMIAAFARFARVVAALGPEERAAARPYLDAARRSAAFIRDRLWNDKRQTLLRRFREGRAEIDGYAEDYAYLVFGLLELYQADPEPAWVEWASTLQRRQDALFWDDQEGGWFSTTGNDPTVLMRLKDDYDGAEPSASSVSVLNLLLLSHLVDDSEWRDRIERTLRLFGSRLAQAGRAVPMMAAALSAYAAGPRQVIIVGEGGDARVLEQTMTARYRPFTLSLTLSESQREGLSKLAPFVAGMRPIDGRSAAYVCRDFVCRAPVTTGGELEALLGDSPGHAL